MNTSKSPNYRHIFCAKCQKEISPIIVTGKTIYPNRPDLWDKKFFQCPVCKNYTEVSRNNKTIPTPEIRRYRWMIHQVIDPLWQNRVIKRDDIYTIMSRKLGHEFHGGELKSIEDAKRAFGIAKELQQEYGGIARVKAAAGKPIREVGRWKKKN